MTVFEEQQAQISLQPEEIAKIFKNIVCYQKTELILANGLIRRLQPGESVVFGKNAIITFCQAGEASIRRENNIVHLTPGSLFIMNPGSQFKIIKASENFDVSSISVSKNFVGNLYVYRKSVSVADMHSFFSNFSSLQLSSEQISLFHSIQNILKETIQLKNNKFQQEMLHSFTLSLMMMLNSLISEKLNSNPVIFTRKDQLITRFLDLLKVHYRESHQVDFYADCLCVTPKYLSVISQKLCGRPASKIINNYLLVQAKKLLKGTSLSILQIADELGFPNQSAFGKYFKKETGLSPSQFRMGIHK